MTTSNTQATDPAPIDAFLPDAEPDAAPNNGPVPEVESCGTNFNAAAEALCGQVLDFDRDDYGCYAERRRMTRKAEPSSATA